MQVLKRIETPLYTVADIRKMEAALFTKQDSYAVMQNAAQALFDVIKADFPVPNATQIAHVVLGAGNNAGDGLLVACLLKQFGFRVRAYRVFTRDFHGDTQRAFIRASAESLDIQTFSPFVVGDNDLIIEAIFGIGLDRPASDNAQTAINHINACKLRAPQTTIYAVDIPAGILTDTGARLGEAIIADKTVTFIGDKIGLHTADGKGCAGEVVIADLGIATIMNA